MRYGLFILATLLTASGSNSSFAFCEDGQEPAPPAVTERVALPACGFAATNRWGPNGCQLCDPRNIYPNPFAAGDGYYAGGRQPYRHHATGTWSPKNW
jgi:hypothetical protein